MAFSPPFPPSDALQDFLSQSSFEQFNASLPSLSFQELIQSFFLLQKCPGIDSQNKLKALFKLIDSPTLLEDIGKLISVEQFVAFLDFIYQYPAYYNRLSFILVGLQPMTFFLALHELQENHLILFKDESLLEPLQFQLNLFAHEGESLHHQTELAINRLKEQFQSIQPQELTSEELDTLLHSIEALQNPLIFYLESSKQALSLAWHTDRIDIIEKLSIFKEALQHQLISALGVRGSDLNHSTGLYLTLEEQLARNFDSSLKDSDAAIEGLTRLSVWHLKDYWELGLLPRIHNMQDLDLDKKCYNEKECWEHHQSLFSQVQQQLEKLQIGTVGTLKKNYLFSKPLLKTYIDQHQHLGQLD